MQERGRARRRSSDVRCQTTGRREHPSTRRRPRARRHRDSRGARGFARRTSASRRRCDRAWVEVARRPLVTILSTGDELRAPGTPARPGSIPESNGVALRAMAERAGAIARIAPLVGDDRCRNGARDHDVARRVRRARDRRRGERRRARLGAPGARSRRRHARLLEGGDQARQAARAWEGGGAPWHRAAGESRLGDGDVRAVRDPAAPRAAGDRAPITPRRRARAAVAFARTEEGRAEFVRATLSRGEGGETWATPLANQASGALVEHGACRRASLRAGADDAHRSRRSV